MVWQKCDIRVLLHSWNSALFPVLIALLEEWVDKYWVLPPSYLPFCFGEQDHSLVCLFLSSDYKTTLIKWLKLGSSRYKSPLNVNDSSRHPACSFLFWIDILMWPLQLCNYSWKRKQIEIRCPALLVLVKAWWWTAICLP